MSVRKRGIAEPGRKELRGDKRMFSGDLLDRVVGGRDVRTEVSRMFSGDLLVRVVWAGRKGVKGVKRMFSGDLLDRVVWAKRKGAEEARDVQAQQHCGPRKCSRGVRLGGCSGSAGRA